MMTRPAGLCQRQDIVNDQRIISGADHLLGIAAQPRFCPTRGNRAMAQSDVREHNGGQPAMFRVGPHLSNPICRSKV